MTRNIGNCGENTSKFGSKLLDFSASTTMMRRDFGELKKVAGNCRLSSKGWNRRMTAKTEEMKIPTLLVGKCSRIRNPTSNKCCLAPSAPTVAVEQVYPDE